VATSIGFVVGFRGDAGRLLTGLAASLAIATVQFEVIHPYPGAVPDWPWGATSLLGFVIGVVAGFLTALKL
jgi:hypothetical protein